MTSEIAPVFPLTQARADVESPTAGIPVPLVDAAVTEPVASYSTEPFLQPPWPGKVADSDNVVVPPLFVQVMVPPVAREAAGAEADL
ncbi:MAG: hypothetical protein ACLQPH_17265 [Acidimicrobiales bacterium]